MGGESRKANDFINLKTYWLTCRNNRVPQCLRLLNWEG